MTKNTPYVTIRFSKGFDLRDDIFTWEIPGPVAFAGLLCEWGSAQAPETLGRIIDSETGGIADHVLITINGRPVVSGDLASATVSPGDMILILPALTGG